MKKNRYQHLMINALLAIALLQGNLNASAEDYSEEGATNKLLKIMKAREDEKERWEKEVEKELEKCGKIAITIPRLAINKLTEVIRGRPPTLLEIVSTYLFS